MQPYYDEAGVTLFCGDCREVMPTLEADSVDCCVTSPPYFGLRDYGTAQWEGGGAGCDHAYNHGVQGTTGQRATRTFTAQAVYRETCRKCGARRIDQQIGLEPSPEAYVAELVAVFREVRRVLKPEGTLFLNLGDSYANDGKWGGHTGGKHAAALHSTPVGRNKRYTGLKPKDLIGIPWRVAFALQADGWYLRSDIIWAKPAPMPESVRDRPTRSHEYVFLLSKSERYFYDAAAIAEPVAEASLTRIAQPSFAAQSGGAKDYGRRSNRSARRALENCARKQDGHGRRHAGFNERWDAAEAAGATLPTRNARDVWTIATEPFPDAHFAVFPTELARRCILAGCPAGGAVLDPFSGSGTVAAVAKQNGHRVVGCDLNAAYCEMAVRRLRQRVMDFAAAE